MDYPPDPDEVQGDGPPLDSHFRRHDDWFEDPWAAPNVRERRKAERHRRWIASLTDRDWARLAERADQVNAGQNFARFDDLDAPIAVGIYDPKAGHLPNGERFGTLRGCVLMAWQKGRVEGH